MSNSESPPVPQDDEGIPAELVRALNGSAEDLRHGRTEDVDGFLGRMEAKQQNHLAAKRGAALAIGPLPPTRRTIET